MSGTANNVIEVSEATFETDVIQQSREKPVVVDFWAPWCGPCRALGPILERLAADPAFDFVLAKLNVDDNPNLAMRYRVQGIPAVKAFVDGKVAAEFVGAQPEAKVRQFIAEVIPDEADRAFREANSLLATRHWAEAEVAFRELLTTYPNYTGAELKLAKALLGQAEGCRAREHLLNAKKSADMLTAQRLLPLAEFLCRAEDESTGLELDMDPIEALYRRAALLVRRNNIEAALDGLLEVLRQDKRYRQGEPKDVMLGLFELLGDGDPLTQSYRNELAMVLF
jgi:putative thioredoxin